MKINIDMEAWELATVIKVLTISDQPEEKKPEGVKPILSDKTREELKKAIEKAIANAFKVPEKVTVLPQKTEPSDTGWVKNMRPEAKSILSDKAREELRTALANAFKAADRLMSEDNPNPNYRPPMGGKPTCS